MGIFQLLLSEMSSGSGNVFLSNANSVQLAFSPDNATAIYSLRETGYTFITSNTPEPWCDPLGDADLFEVRVTELSGTLSTGTVGSWEALSTARSWTLTQSGVGTDVCTILVEIRAVSGGSVLTSATINFAATVEA